MNITALVLKFVTGLVAYAVGLDLFFSASWIDILSFSLTLTIISYFIGDKILLPRIGNANALVVDFFLSYAVVWLFGSVLFNSYRQIGWGSIISAIVITAGEFFVHRMLHSSVPQEGRTNNGATQKLAYGMEMAEENEPIKKK